MVTYRLIFPIEAPFSFFIIFGPDFSCYGSHDGEVRGWISRLPCNHTAVCATHVFRATRDHCSGNTHTHTHTHSQLRTLPLFLRRSCVRTISFSSSSYSLPRLHSPVEGRQGPPFASPSSTCSFTQERNSGERKLLHFFQPFSVSLPVSVACMRTMAGGERQVTKWISHNQVWKKVWRTKMLYPKHKGQSLLCCE